MTAAFLIISTLRSCQISALY